MALEEDSEKVAARALPRPTTGSADLRWSLSRIVLILLRSAPPLAVSKAVLVLTVRIGDRRIHEGRGCVWTLPLRPRTQSSLFRALI